MSKSEDIKEIKEILERIEKLLTPVHIPPVYPQYQPYTQPNTYIIWTNNKTGGEPPEYAQKEFFPR